jgi:hypothetical protein
MFKELLLEKTKKSLEELKSKYEKQFSKPINFEIVDDEISAYILDRRTTKNDIYKKGLKYYKKVLDQFKKDGLKIKGTVEDFDYWEGDNEYDEYERSIPLVTASLK